MKSKLHDSNFKDEEVNFKEKKKRKKASSISENDVKGSAEHIESDCHKKPKKRKKEQVVNESGIDMGETRVTESENSHFDSEQKMPKKSTNVELEKTIDSDNDSTTDNAQEGLITKEMEELTGKYLRRSINSSNGLDTLKKFVKICNENKGNDVVADYLNNGGNILEILRLLTEGDKKNTGNATTVFSAVTLLLIKIMATHPQYRSNAEQACRHLLNSHLPLIHSMLSVQSNAKQRKTVLKLLSAVVSLSGSLAKELLAHLSIQPQTLDHLIRHSKPTDPQSVRTCFIQFLLAFLVEGNVPVIRALLEKRGLLTSIFPGLIYDSKEVLNLVLSTIKAYILENSGISKTVKLHVFSTSVIQNLMCLYNWKGPTNWKQHKDQKVVASQTFLEDKEEVMDILHNFLVTLLTSHKHGVIFHDHSLGSTHAKNNQLVNTVLQSLERPWEHERVSELLIKILATCPDVIAFQNRLLEPYIEPRLSKKWITLMKFVKKIIENIDLEKCLQHGSTELSARLLADAIMPLVMPGMIVKTGIIPSLMHSEMLVRHTGINVLIVMFSKVEKIMSIAKIIYGKIMPDPMFVNRVMEHIVKMIPKLDIILKIWKDAFIPVEGNQVNLDDDNDILVPKKHEHLNDILSLLQYYTVVCPELLDSSTELEPTKFLTMLDTLDSNEISELNVKVKAVQLLLSLNPTEFAPDKKAFGEVLSFVSSILDEEDTAIVQYAKSALNTLLKNTGMFELCEDQLGIWIHGLMNLKNLDTRTEVTRCLISAAKKVSQNLEKYINLIIETEEMVNQTLAYTAGVEDIFSDLEKETTSKKKAHDDPIRMLRCSSVSPLLCYLLRKMEKNNSPALSSYVSYVSVHTLHHQVSPECLLHLVKVAPEMAAGMYLQSWLSKSESVHLEMSDSTTPAECTLSSVLLADSELSLNKIFQGTNMVTFKLNGENITINHSMTEYEILSLFKMSVFYLTRFAEWGILTETQAQTCKAVLISCLHIANQFEDKSLFYDCAKSVLCHPIIVTYFSPFSQKKKATVGSIVTYLVYEVSSVVAELCEVDYARNLSSHLRKKFLSQLLDVVEKKTKVDKLKRVDVVISLTGLLQLTAENIVCCLNVMSSLEFDIFTINDNSDLSVCGYLMAELLRLACHKQVKSERAALVQLVPTFFKNIWNIFIHMKKTKVPNVHKWELVLIDYLKNYPHNISEITADSFSLLLKSEITDSTIRLVSFLVGTNEKLVPSFVDYVTTSENYKHSRIVFPIMGSNLSYKWKNNFLQKLYKHYREEIVSYLSQPQSSNSWIDENTDVVLHLIRHTFAISDCEEISSIILETGDKLEMVSINYVQHVQTLYSKFAALKSEDQTPMVNLIQILLHIFTLTLKKESKNVDKLSVLCGAVAKTVTELKERRSDNFVEEVSSTNSWSQFTRFALKTGLKVSKDNKPLPVLKTLTILCDIAYKDNCNEEYPKVLFEMTTSHSEFINIMLGSSELKKDLIEFLWILIKKNKSIMASTHVPLYLAAYNATLSEADQFILSILQCYERSDVAIHEYRPYLWGNAAAVHYSVRGETDMALWRQPTTAQVLNLFEKDLVVKTIKHYPVNRGLKDKDLYERNEVYDPAFYLPLLCFLLSENNVVSCQKLAQSGALALLFSSCGSSDADVRMAAYTVISRYYSHLEASRSKANLLWMRLIDAVRYGIVTLGVPIADVQLNCIVSTFLAQTSLVATQPLNPLYAPLQTFLVAKPALDLKTIPELLQLLHSSDIHHKAHRHWILEIIRDGIRTENDTEIAFKCLLFKVLLDFYTSNLTDARTKRLILEVVYAAAKLPRASMVLVNGYGLLPWLLEVTKNLDNESTQQISLLLKIADALSNTILSVKAESVNYRCVYLHFLLALQKRFTKNIGIAMTGLYISILHKLLICKNMAHLISKEHIVELVTFCKEFLGDVDDCENMLHYGCEFVNIQNSTHAASELDAVKTSLKRVIYTWYSKKAV